MSRLSQNGEEDELILPTSYLTLMLLLTRYVGGEEALLILIALRAAYILGCPYFVVVATP